MEKIKVLTLKQFLENNNLYIDDLLDKINSVGYNNLTNSELNQLADLSSGNNIDAEIQSEPDSNEQIFLINNIKEILQKIGVVKDRMVSYKMIGIDLPILLREHKGIFYVIDSFGLTKVLIKCYQNEDFVEAFDSYELKYENIADYKLKEIEATLEEYRK